MTKTEKFLRKWQHLLRVDDWDITFKEVKRFKSDVQFGATSVNPRFVQATIKLKKGLSKKEMEITIIHELLHVRFPYIILKEGSDAEASFEVGIESMARMLQRKVRV
jgi:hypothetical protein